VIRAPAGVVPADSIGASDEQRVRRHLVVSGLVQGVGFRPFVFRLATELGLCGSVRNTQGGVRVEVEGEAGAIDEFTRRLQFRPPEGAVVRGVDATDGAAVGVEGFSIGPSDETGTSACQVPRDLAPCPECARGAFDPADRLYRYPFATCTRCGPRFTVIRTMPYDRAHTTMAAFALCKECRREYEDPGNRRFHAQSIACPMCGPQLAWWDGGGNALARADQALREAADAIRRGAIVAVKGVGGFHLMVDAANEGAVRELRRRKQRPDKPFALLCESLTAARTLCHVGEVEGSLLTSPAAPIVLLRARGSAVAPSVAPGNPYLGVMLPPSPLHLLLTRELATPVVATSGNRSEEPICTREEEALARFQGIADFLLVHDRPIARHADDSVVRVIKGEGVVLRVGRGYAPLVVPSGRSKVATLAVGGGQKNSVAVTAGEGIVLSQHVGSLASAEGRAAFRRTAADLGRLHGSSPSVTAGDLHPDDAAAREGRSLGHAIVAVQHHHAHVVSCMAEHGLDGPVLGIAWDGTGYGPDGTIWGGEFLVADRVSWRRAGHLRRLQLPGGERAVREPRRAALGALFELFGARVAERDDLAPVAAFSRSERAIIAGMLARGINSPVTSSAGRLFDAVSALVGIRQIATFEGQAAMELEFAAEEAAGVEPYPLAIAERDGSLVVDWEPAMLALLEDLGRNAPVPRIARAFHDALAEAIVAVAQRAGQDRVVLTGGCFQNRYLAERASDRLAASGFQVYRHRAVPPNDGGIALGQAVAAGAAGL
jgi:hydrogenase maturation protein HypF